MSKEIVASPDVRFVGFSDDWESHQLSDIGNFKNGMNFSKEALGHGFPFVNLQDVFGRNIVNGAQLGLAPGRPHECLVFRHLTKAST